MRRRYHHGDLRAALLDATLAIVRKEGPAAITLRDVAKRAGVSEAAPYHHFESKSHLLLEAAAQGYAALGARLTAAAVDPEARARLVAVAAAYVRFALDEPGYFRLLFGAHIAELTSAAVGHPALDATQQAGRAAAMHLRDGVAGFIRESGAVIDARSLERLVWAQIHGLAWLVLEQELRPQPSDDEAVALAATGIDRLLAGVVAPSVRARTRPTRARTPAVTSSR